MNPTNPKDKKPRGGARVRQEPPREKRPQRAGAPKQKLLRVLFVIATVLAAIIVVLFIAWKIFVKPPERPSFTPRPQPTAGLDENGDPIDIGEAPGAVSSDRKEDFWTFMVVGRDTYGGGNTDTIMMMSYDIPNQKLSVMNIPRDTMVNVPWDIKRINSVYNYAPYYDKEGVAFLKEEVSQLVGFEPDFTIVVEWEAVGELVDAIGGVYFDVPRRMYYNDLSQNFKIDLQKGYQLLNGSQAMQLVRYRHDSDDSGHILNTGYADGDLGRIKVQQDFLKAVVSQCLQFKNVTKINSLAKVFTENVTSEPELSINNLAWFAQQAIFGGLNMDSVNFFTMPNTGVYAYSRTYYNNQSYVTPNADELVDLVNEHLNPYKDDLKKSELDIMYVNRDGTIGCTGSALADTKHNAVVQSRNSAPASPKPAETEPPESPEPGGEDPGPGEDPDPSETESPLVTPEPSPTPSTPGGAIIQPPVSTVPTPSPAPTPTPAPAPVPDPEPLPENPVPTSGPGMEPVD